MTHTSARVWQWTGIILILCLFGGAYWYFQVYAGVKTNVSPTGALTSGLVGYWTFDGADVSGATATDRGSGGNNGTLTNGPTVTQGKLGQALSFDGSDDYVLVADANSLDITGAITLSTWIKTSDTDSCILSKSASIPEGCFGQATTKVFELGILSSTLWFQIGNGTSAATVSGSASGILDNQWHHVTATWDGTTGANGLKLYIDGVLTYQATSSVSAIQLATTEFLFAGKNGIYDYAGLIDETRIYNTALTAAEIQSLYKAGESDTINVMDTNGNLNSGLTGYWALNEGTGTSILNSAVVGGSTSLTGTPSWVTGQVGSALDFDGIDDTANVAYDAAFTSSTMLTYSFWAKPDLNDGYGILGSLNGENSSSYGRISIDNAGVQAGTPQVFILRNIGGATTTRTVTFTYPVSTWFHYVYTYDGVSERVYINGSLSGEWAQTGTFASNTEFGLVLGRGHTVAQYYDGALDEVRMYNRALSATEAAQLYRYSGPAAADSGLVGHWSFNGTDTTSTKAYDRSGTGNTGTLSGPAIAEGKVGQALLFDGVDDNVNLDNPSALQSLTDFSMAAWIYVDSDRGASTDYIVSQYDGGGIAEGDFLWYVDTNDALVVNIDGATAAVTSSAITENEWHYVALTVDGDDRIDLYVDGTLNVSDTAIGTTAPYLHNANDLKIGSMHAGTNPFQGIIDEVRMYNTILTAAQIQSLYKQGQSDEVNTGASQAQGTGRLDSGLAGYWKLDDGSGTNATDSSTNGNAGTLTLGPTWTTGQIGGAVSFDGVDDYIDTDNGSSMDNLTQLTHAMWIYPTSDNGFLIAKRNSGGGHDGFRLTSGTLQGWISNFVADSVARSTSSTTVSLNVWSHVAMTYSHAGDKKVRLYINGSEVAYSEQDTNPSGTDTDTGFDFYIGTSQLQGAPFTGNIDEVRIYNRALSADEVAQLYRLNVPTGTETGLKGYWSFNGKDLSGTTAYDRSGAGNTGTLTNGPAVTEGRLGQGLSFDGTNDYVNIPDSTSLSPTAAMTVSFWTNITSSISSQCRSFLAKNASGQRSWALTATTSGGVVFYVATNTNDTGTYGSTGGGLIAQNQWAYVTAVFDGAGSGNADRAKIYVNGVQSSVTFTGTIPASLTDTSQAVRFGESAMSCTALPGYLDEVRIYNRALTEAEIKSLYNASR